MHVCSRLRQENEQLKYQAREASRQSAVPQQAEPTTVTQPDQDARACMLPSHAGQPKPHLEGKAPSTEPAAPATATPDLPAGRLDMATPQAASAAAAEGCGLPTQGHSRGVPIGLECRNSGAICDASAREQVFPPDPSSPPTEPASVEKPSNADSKQQKQPDKIMVDAAAAVDLALNEAAQGAAASSREQLATLTATREATLSSAACIDDMHATLTEAYNSGFGSQCTAPDEQVLGSLEHMQEDGSDAAMTASQERCEEGCGSRQEADRAADGAEGASCRPDQAAGGVHAAVSEPGQAAEELHDKLGSVVALVSAVCGSFSPHDTAGALLQNLQVPPTPLFSLIYQFCSFAQARPVFHTSLLSVLLHSIPPRVCCVVLHTKDHRIIFLSANIFGYRSCSETGRSNQVQNLTFT